MKPEKCLVRCRRASGKVSCLDQGPTLTRVASSPIPPLAHHCFSHYPQAVTNDSKDIDKPIASTAPRPSQSDSLSSWLPKHDARLRHLVDAAGKAPDWKDIARQMQHWSARQCEARYNKMSSQINKAGGE